MAYRSDHFRVRTGTGRGLNEPLDVGEEPQVVLQSERDQGTADMEPRCA